MRPSYRGQGRNFGLDADAEVDARMLRPMFTRANVTVQPSADIIIIIIIIIFKVAWIMKLLLCPVRCRRRIHSLLVKWQCMTMRTTHELHVIITDQFSGPASAVRPWCPCVCSHNNFKRNDLFSRCLTFWSVLVISRWYSKAKFMAQSLRSHMGKVQGRKIFSVLPRPTVAEAVLLIAFSWTWICTSLVSSFLS